MLLNYNNFKFLTDENIQSDIVAYLRETGFDVTDVKELKYNGMSDNFLFDYALNQSRVIITHDSDFGKIIFNNNFNFVGIIYLRPGHFNPAISINSLKAIFKQNIDIKQPFMITAENNKTRIKIRIREF